MSVRERMSFRFDFEILSNLFVRLVFLPTPHRPELKPVEKEIEVVMKFPDVEPLNPPVLMLNEIAFKYNVDKVIFNCVNLSATLDSRICIVGENGAGKTTLLKVSFACFCCCLLYDDSNGC